MHLRSYERGWPTASPFHMPPNPAGEVKLTGRPQPQAISQAPPQRQALPDITPTPLVSLPLPFTICAASCRASTLAGDDCTWKVTDARLQPPITFSHSTINSGADIQWDCNWYCEESETFISYESHDKWRADLEKQARLWEKSQEMATLQLLNVCLYLYYLL